MYIPKLRLAEMNDKFSCIDEKRAERGNVNTYPADTQ